MDGWFIMESPITMDDLELAPVLKKPTYALKLGLGTLIASIWGSLAQEIMVFAPTKGFPATVS